MKTQHFKTLMLLLSTLSLLLTGCGEGRREERVSFDQKFPKSNKNLESILGKSFQCKTDSGQVYTINVKYDPTTQRNAITLTDAEGGIDSIANCWVSKFRGLYYFSEPFKDNSYSVYAVKITEDEIKGLIDGSFQLMYLREQVDKGEFKDLVISSDTSRQILLSFDKHRLKTFFAAAVDSCSYFPLKRIKPVEALEDKPSLKPTQAKMNENLPQKNKIEVITNLYPNPTAENITITFKQAGIHNISIYNLQRQLMKTLKAKDEKITINLDEFESGPYSVIVSNDSGQSSSSRFILQ